VATDDKEIVSALRTALADRVGKKRFDLWFGASTRMELRDGTLTIGVPSPFLLDWLRGSFRRQIEAACVGALGHCPRLEFLLEQARPRSVPMGPMGGPPRGKRADDSVRPSSPPTAQSTGEAVPADSAPRRRFNNLESFVRGPCNRLAVAAVEMVCRRPGEVSPLVVYGPTGVGKSHLLEGIWTAVRGSRHGRSAVYLTAEQFASGFLQAIRGSGLPSFRRKYRGVDLLIIDDLQFLGGKRYTQMELRYTIDTLLREGRQLVLAGDRPPAKMCDLGPELTARLESGMVCPIEPPDLETRTAIVAQMARRLEVSVPPAVCRYIAERFTQHARELSGALCRLKATCQATHQPVTVALAEEALDDLVRQSSRVIRLADIEKAVCTAFGLEPDTLQSGRKAKNVSQPRMLAMWLARKYTRAALTEIGHYFGRRSHSTVAAAKKRVDGWLSDDQSVELADRPTNIHEALRHVEQCLRVG